MSRTVQINNTQHAIELDLESAAALAGFVLEAEAAPDPLEVSIAFVDDAVIAGLNERHLEHEGPTDVLAFPMDDAPPKVAVAETPDVAHEGAEPGVPAEQSAQGVLGDVIVSAERAIAFCRDYGGDPLDELALYLVHGLLHLLGYDDLTEADCARMEQRQAELLERAAKAGVVLHGRVGHTD